MQRAAVIVATAFAALVGAASAHAQPNVVLIVTDDQRWDTLEYMPVVRSELVGKGITFSNAFAVNPLCCPSRASMLTGLYSHTTGVWVNRGPFGGFHAFGDQETLPVWLERAGYETMLVGKYLNRYGQDGTQPGYVPPGWDHWLSFWGSARYYNYALTDNTVYGENPEDYSTDVLAARAVDFIRATQDPFFLYFAPFAPHFSDGKFSIEPAPRHVDRFAGVALPRPPSVNEPNVGDKPRPIRNRPLIPEEQLTELREEQLEALLAVDDAVAAMLEALAETGKLANTLVVFTSDNGNLWGEHRWPSKVVPYEESIRVPLVFRYDALLEPAGAERRTVLNIDLAPTIAAAARAATPRVEGRSIMPLLLGETTTWRRSFLFESGPGWPPSYCGFRSSRWKYVQYRTGEEELYHLVSDPYELRSRHRHNAMTSRVMRYRWRLLRSPCRPPGFRPLTRCTRTGTRHSDRLVGMRREDWICAGEGNDRIFVRGDHRDVVRCGPGVDRVRADRRDSLRSCEIRLR